MQKLHLLVFGFNSYKDILIRPEIMSPLIQVLKCGRGLEKKSTARCFMKLTENLDNVWFVSVHGGVSTLLKICAEKRFKTGISRPIL